MLEGELIVDQLLVGETKRAGNLSSGKTTLDQKRIFYQPWLVGFHNIHGFEDK